MSSTELATLTGRVVRPGDADYSVASAGYNLLFAHRPIAVVFAQETTDVVNALAWAQQNGVPVRARSGRHCLEGWNAVDGGIVIDVSELKSATIDADARTAVVGAGLNQMEAVTALGAQGFAAPTGTEGSVGLVGATLGGGFGLLTRPYGMASDNLLAAEIVIPTEGGAATAVIADEHNNTDLLWALRGAGNGNFGVVTSLTYRIHSLPQAIHIVATWAGLDNLPEVFEVWQHSAPHADNRLTSQLEITRDTVGLIGVLAGGAEAEAVQLLAPILSIGSPEVTVHQAAWPEVYERFQVPLADDAANWKYTSQFITDPYPREALDVITSFVAKAPTPESNYFTNALRGAVLTNEPAGGSAYAHRDALFYAEPGAGWGRRGGPVADEALTSQCLTWIAEFSEALQPFTNGAYTNVPNPGTPDYLTQYWGDNVDRLRAVKAKYDPNNIFSFEQSIKPAG